MLKFIWNSWWRNKERFILLLVGVLILSTGLSYLVGITQANNGTVVDELQKRWKSSYHIVVRPVGSRSVTEELNLLEPNYLSGLEGGISLEQYEQIKAMADVEIAAPIAMIGSNTNYVELEDPNITEPGIYRMKMVEETNTGAGIETDEYSTYITAGSWTPEESGAIDYGISPGIPNLSYGTSIMIAGIDPEAEAAIAGLEGAIVPSATSRYFNERDMPISAGEVMGVEEFKIPVIISNQDFVDAEITYSYEKLDIPFETDTQATAEDIMAKGGEDYLDSFEGTPVKEFTYNTTDVHGKLIEKILDPTSNEILSVPDFSWIALKPSTVKYSPVTSPFPERWPYTYEVEPFELPSDSPWATKHMYRQFNPYSTDSSNWPRLQMDFVGVFDPQKLQISKDPLTELPMETYFPAKAQWVMDSDNNPINPPAEMKPTNDDYGFLTKPPLVLTTLEAAAQILGDTPISAIRVNVKGVELMDEESEALLQQVAAEIEQQTGLITDITLGSSPQLALTHLPGLGDEEALGWVQQPWIKIGSSISIFKEAKIGMSGVIASVILVAIVYVFASSIIMLFARKKEFAVLLALGWRPSQLSKLLFLEATILGGLVALISWFILGAFFVSGSVDTSALRVFLIGVSGLAIYWLGSLIPIALIRRIKPFESMRSGEVSHRAKRIVRSESVIGMSFNNLFSQWQRSVLSVLAIAVPTSLFIFFLFVTFRLQGVLYATWLGEFVALEVGTMHYVAMGVALLIAILTTTEIMWQNVSERQAQIAVLKATGWQNSGVRALVLWEGVFTGLLAGIIGMAISLVIIYSMYGQLPTEEFGFLSLTMLIPVITGVLGALLPAEKAARILPYQAINGTLQNSKKVEKQFKWALGAAGAILVAGIFSLFLFTLPEINNEPSGNVSETATTGTEGAMLDGASEEESEQSLEAEEIAETATGEIAKLQEIAYRSYTLGDGTDDTAEFRLGDLVETPAGVQVTNDQNRLISFPVTLDRSTDADGGSTTYKPHGFKMMDDNGTEYPVVNMEVTEGGDKWRHKYKFMIPNKMTAILTYELPKELDRAVFVASGEFYPSPVVVEIPLENAASGTVIDELKKNAYRTFDLGDENFEQTLELTFDQPVEPPQEVSVSNPNNQLISIPVTLEMDGEGGWLTYKPHGFRLVDQTGNEYSSTHMEITEKGNWKGKYKFITPSKTSVILTYELPKNVEQIVLTASNAILPGMLVVDIPLAGSVAKNKSTSAGASAAYNIDLALDAQDVFQISAQIEVTNESQDSWKDIGFYFIPNALTDANKPDFMEDGAETAISSITADGEEIPFELIDNRLLLKLDAELKPDEIKKVKIDYTLKLPENGNRLSQMDDNFYLAQWYPMLGHYNDGWNIEDYDSKGESYHTSYGSYEINYQLPAEYLVVSSAEDGEILPTASGTVAGANIKDFYLALMDPDDWHTATSSVNDTMLRVYIPSGGLDFTADMMAVVEDAFASFEEKIADHPAEELDIIANDGGMEYPNIIEVTSNPSDYEHTLIHEIAHQWFYYLVANDPYTDSWLDESITEWVASMYMVEEGYPNPFDFAENMATAGATTHLINLALDEFEEGEYYSTVYGKTPLLLQEYFEANGGSDAAFAFLAAYVEQFRFAYVDTATFAEFFVAQNGEDSREFLNSWLDLERE